MKIIIRKLMFVLICIVTYKSSLAAPIEVLIAKSPTVSDGAALFMLDQMNDLMNQSNLSHRDFVNAGSSNYVEEVDGCPVSTDPNVFLQCATGELVGSRNALAADIVIFLVPYISATRCGGVYDDMINRPNVSRNNHALAYAYVSESCLFATGLVAASHEALHLLYIEHQDQDPELDDPERDNHGAASQYYGTAGATPADCDSPYTKCTQFKNWMSEPGRTFPGGWSAGNSLHSNVKRVVNDVSWDVVATYRPIPRPCAASVRTLFLGCHQPYCALWDFSYSSCYASQYRIEAQLWPGGPWGLRTVTSSTSYYPHLGQNGKYWRIRGESSVGVGDWTVIYVPGKCGDSGGGGPIP